MARLNLPNFLLIGAAKSGTTTLNSVLDAHPEVFMSLKKSPRYFNKDKNYSKGLSWYATKFFSNSESYSARGEATPSYLAQAETTATRIHESFPGKKLKFIAIFRNPVERAYSHYWYNFSKITGEENSESFEKAFQKDLENYKKGIKPNPNITQTLNYFRNGQYCRWIKEFYKYFKPEQFLFLITEDLYPENYQESLKKISTFLQVKYYPIEYKRENTSRIIDTSGKKEWIIKNRRLIMKLIKVLPDQLRKKIKWGFKKSFTKPGKYPKIDDELRAEITDLYLGEITELEEIINRDLSHWKNDG